MRKKILWGGGIIGLGVILAFIISGCTGGPAAEPTVTAENCANCHNESTLVLAKRLQWDMSTHGTGTAYGRSTSAGCAGCHSSEGWVARIAAGISNPDNVQQGVTNPTPPNCRTCHDIHNTYTEADFALRTTEPVTLYASGATFDMGEGNLCATCHQPRREMEAVDGVVKVDSTHWGPHHGPQSTMLLGIGGAGVSGGPSGHYMTVTEGCPVCHMANDRHEMQAAVSACQSCHSGLTNFDYNGVQTEVEGLLQELAELLMAKGMLASASHEPYHAGIALSDLHPVVGNYPEAQAAALWNFIYISVEDSSKGVHNSKYTIDLLESSIAALQ